MITLPCIDAQSGKPCLHVGYTSQFYGWRPPGGRQTFWTSSSHGSFQGCNLEFTIDVIGVPPLAGTETYRAWRDQIEDAMDAAVVEYDKECR